MKYLLAILSCVLLAFVYYKITDENVISEDAWQQIELDRSQNAYEKERRGYLITIMFQQVGITLLLFFIPMMFLLYQNRKIQKKLQHRIASFNSLSLFDTFSKPDKMSLSRKLVRRHPDLTAKDLELCILLMQHMDTKEVASRFNITTASVYTARYRLRKKMNLLEDEDLTVYLTQLGS